MVYFGNSTVTYKEYIFGYLRWLRARQYWSTGVLELFVQQEFTRIFAALLPRVCDLLVYMTSNTVDRG